MKAYSRNMKLITRVSEEIIQTFKGLTCDGHQALPAAIVVKTVRQSYNRLLISLIEIGGN